MYNRFLSKNTKTIWKNWNISQINKNLKEIFKNKPITAFKQNKKIQEIIGRHWIENVRVNKKTLKEGKCTPCRSKAGNLCCKQVKITTRFKSQQKKKKNWKIFYNTNCDAEYTIYLMECILCNLQYVREN